MRLIQSALAALCLAACASTPPPEAPVGRLYTYLRSNQDGSLPETIYQYRASATQLEVGKIVSPCTNAAFVTADMDLEAGHGLRFVGGRIGRDANQEPFAWLDYDASARDLHARIPQANLDVRLGVDSGAWVLYDFDLSDLNALLTARSSLSDDFQIGIILIWPEEGAANPLRNLGRADARFAGEARHLDRAALRFDVSGAVNGQIWLDAREGHVLEARFAEPNHTEYADFRLVLQSVEDDAAATWLEARRAHWRDCP